MTKAWLLFLIGGTAFGQTTVQLRASGQGFWVVGATNTTPIVIQTGTAHGLAQNDAISIWNVPFNSGDGCGSGGVLNGRFRADTTGYDATHFAVLTTGGSPVTAMGSWCDGSLGGSPGGAQWGGKVTPFTLETGMKGWFDGDNGPFTRSVSMGTANGLVSLTVSGNIATVVGPPGYVTTGDKIAVWGSGNAALNASGNPYTVTSDSATQFHFTTSGVANGTYTGANLTCGPARDTDCLRISKKAYTGNPWWDAVLVSNSLWGNKVTLYDGGDYPLHYDSDSLGSTVSSAVKFLVDPSDTVARNSVKYWLTHAERVHGSFAAVEEYVGGGNYNFGDFASFTLRAFALYYAVGRDYLTPAERQTFLDKIYNERTDTTPCNKWLALTKLITSGTTQSGDTSHITLDTTASSVDDFYVSMSVEVKISSGALYRGVITAYDGATKSATISGVWGGGFTPTASSTYRVEAGMSFTGNTITGYGTQWQTDSDPTRRVAPGDLIYYEWTGGYGGPEYYVTAVNSDTSLTVLTAYTGTVGPGVMRIVHKWEPGNCGAIWLRNHWVGALTHPVIHPPSAGYASKTYWPSDGSNNGYSMMSGHLAMGLAAADDDPRAVKDVERMESNWWDYYIPMSLGYTSGYQRAGAYYSFGRTMIDGPMAATWLANSVTGFPSQDLTGNWITRPVMMKIYGMIPDQAGGKHWPVKWGTEVGDNSIGGRQLAVYATDYTHRWAPGSDEAKYWRGFLNAHSWSNAGSVNNGYAALQFLTMDPSVPALDYTTLPTQFFFHDTSQPTCAAMGLTLCSTPDLRADGFISRTGWTRETDSHLMFMARSYVGGDHDRPQAGVVRLYKSGFLLGPGTQAPGNAQQNDINTRIDDMPEFGGTNTLRIGRQTGPPGIASMERWGGGNPFGFADSSQAYGMSEIKGMYTNSINRAQRHVIHFKKPGTEEVIMVYDDIDVTGAPTQIRGQIHYPQNGEPAQLTYGIYAEGTTTCPGTGDCANLDINRTVLERQDGVGSRTMGLLTKFFSPSSIQVRWDGGTYAGSQGHDNRVSICAGSCGASVSGADYVTVHKVLTTMDDVDLAATPMFSDPLWAGVQTTDKVGLFSRGGKLRMLAKFQTTHAGVAQYLIAGLAVNEEYRVYRHDDKTDVVLRAVLNRDNSLYFEGPAGSYSVFPSALSNLVLGNRPDLRTGVPMSHDFRTAGAAATYLWRISGGALPAGLTLSTDGVLSGTPLTQGDYSVTIEAVTPDDASVSAATTITLSVAPPMRTTISGVTSTRGLLYYAETGMDANQRCTLTVSDRDDFAGAAETVVDNGGAAQRFAVLGESGGLLPGMHYYVRVVCGSIHGAAEFETAAISTGTATEIAVSLHAPAGLPIATTRIQYGTSPQLGNFVAAPCTGSCVVPVPALTGTVVYLQHAFLDSSQRVIAQGRVVPVVVKQ